MLFIYMNRWQLHITKTTSHHFHLYEIMGGFRDIWSSDDVCRCEIDTYLFLSANVMLK